jgi:hypothetical protein
MKENLLRQVLGLGSILKHSQTDAVGVFAMGLIEVLEGCRITLLRTNDRFLRCPRGGRRPCECVVHTDSP